MARGEGNRSGVWVWAGLAVLVLLGGLWYLRGSREAVPVVTAQVGRTDLSVPVSTNGKVEATQDFQAHAPIPGYVQSLKVAVGEQVRPGDVLLELDTTDARNKLATAEAQLAASRLALANIHNGGSQDELLSERADLQAAQEQEQRTVASVATMKQLQARGSASANEVSKAQQGAADAHAKVLQVESRLHGRYSSGDLAAQQAQVEQAESAVAAARSDLQSVVVRSTLRGTVYSVPVAQHDYVGAGAALINIADLSHLQVRAYFDEPDIGKLANGQPVAIRWEAKPNRTWHGHVTQVPTTIVDYNTRNVGECLISIDDATGDLIPNTNVTVTVTTHQQRDVMTLPHEALHTVGSETFVYKVVNGRLQHTLVELGDYNPTRIQILSGVSIGDIVALNAQSPSVELRDGMRVEK